MPITILTACDHRDKLLKQLWPLSIPGETDTPIHQQHPSPQAATGLWQGRERARLAVRGGSCPCDRLDFHNGKIAETYNIGGFNEWKNIDIIKVVINTVDSLLGRKEGEDMDLITYVTDRLGHDVRYAIDSTKLQKELGWEPSLQFEEGIERTVRWYLEKHEWCENIINGEYQDYYVEMYGNR